MLKHALILLSIIISLSTFAQDRNSFSLEELEARISRILEVNDIPAIGLAILNKDGSTYARSFGMANREENIPADENTIYRLGSITKLFTAIAVMQLVERGQLGLEDRVLDIVPDVLFINPWSETHPIRLRHLLEHTTGWDDLHGPEWASNDPTPLTTKEGLEVHPHSRISRWPPGTRMAYSNAGAPVAAYMIEKVTGETFEDYVNQNILAPLAMRSTSLTFTETYRKHRATSYGKGKVEGYYHMAGRAAGALNASPKDMLQLIKVFINRGRLDSTILLSEPSVTRMESPSEKFGFSLGYGLGNFSSLYNGFVFYGHNGAVNTSLANFVYLPGHKLGYAVMMTTMNNKVFRQLNMLITDYLIAGLEPESVLAEAKPRLHNEKIEGYYVISNPRNHKFRITQNLFEPARVKWKNDTLYFGPVFGNTKQRFVPTGTNKYASIATGRDGLYLSNDFDNSKILHKSVFGGVHSFKPVSALLVYGKLVIFILSIILSLITLVIGVIKLIKVFLGERSDKFESSLVFGTSITSALLLVAMLSLMIIFTDPVNLIYRMNGVNVILFLASLGFGIFTILVLGMAVISWPKVKRKPLYIFLAIVVLIHFLYATYLHSMGMIYIQTWS